MNWLDQTTQYTTGPWIHVLWTQGEFTLRYCVNVVYQTQVEDRISEKFLPNWNKRKDNLGKYATFEYDTIRNRYFFKIQVCLLYWTFKLGCDICCSCVLFHWWLLKQGWVVVLIFLALIFTNIHAETRFSTIVSEVRGLNEKCLKRLEKIKYFKCCIQGCWSISHVNCKNKLQILWCSSYGIFPTVYYSNS